MYRSPDKGAVLLNGCLQGVSLKISPLARAAGKDECDEERGSRFLDLIGAIADGEDVGLTDFNRDLCAIC